MFVNEIAFLVTIYIHVKFDTGARVIRELKHVLDTYKTSSFMVHTVLGEVH